MGTETRPLDCILFICDQLDERMDDAARGKLDTLEQVLRESVAKAGEILQTQAGLPLLLMADRQDNNITKERQHA